NANGIGLAANQVGREGRLLVVDISETEENEEKKKEAKPLVVINPEILTVEGEAELEEGCLSIPDIRDKVVRVEKIRLLFRDANFKEQELDADGMLARVILHEVDHLDGVLFTDHLGATKRALLKSKLKKISKGEIETKYPVVVVPAHKGKKRLFNRPAISGINSDTKARSIG
ncbi:MAG: peptide deformylase, partial [Bacteroidota bacterium]|nr:peptide deformylase [Bacteroidota bacterium]